MNGIYTRICELLNRHDVPDAPWKSIVAIVAVLCCIGTAVYHFIKVAEAVL